MGNAGNSAKSVHNDRDGRQQGTSEQRTRLVLLRLPLGHAILEDAQILCRMEGQQGKTGCPEIKWGSTVKPIRKMLFSEVTTAPNSSGEIVAKATRDDPMGKSRVGASDSLLADRRKHVVLIAPTEFVDHGVNAHSGSGGKLVHQIPNLFVGGCACQ